MMSYSNNELSKLFQRYYANIASKEEEEALMQLLSAHVSDEELAAILRKEWESSSFSGTYFSSETGKQLLRTIVGEETARPAHRIHFLKTTWFRYAAVIIAILGISSYLWLSNRHQPVSTAANNAQRANFNADIPPGGNKATLTLADGSQITLDNTANGTLAKQGNAQVIKLANGQLAYQLKGLAGKEVLLNTMTTPKGGQYKIQLPDGTNVWLNAASSITYPTAFTGSIREVTVEGEAYFEVKQNKDQPFFVKTKTSNIQVLGTSFNINAYREEPFKTSLIEGSIKVNDQILSPGQAYRNGKVVNTDIDQDIAWKNGLFNFNDLPLKEAMNQLARWYDLEIVYKDKLTDFYFIGEMGRDLSLNEVLRILSSLGADFKLEGKKVIVSAK